MKRWVLADTGRTTLGTSAVNLLNAGIPAPRRRYVWRIAIEGISEEIGFWVQQPPQQPVIGGSG